jgi:hypothetical protein
VPEVERHIRTIKERAYRCVYNTPSLQETAQPDDLVELALYYSVFWLELVSLRKMAISDTLQSSEPLLLAPASISTSTARWNLAPTCQAHEEHDNGMATRTTGAIALRPTGNLSQGGYYHVQPCVRAAS